MLEDVPIFPGFVGLHREVSKSQLFQDLWVLWESQQKRNGFFVEIGAGDGVYLSNTYVLEKLYGWTGILAEPLASFHESIETNRSVALDKRAVWRETGATMTFLEAQNREYSGLEITASNDPEAEIRTKLRGSSQVQTVTLSDLLHFHGAPRQIDYLSIDTEGAELDALSGLPFEDYDVKMITIEHNYDPDRRTMINNELKKHDFIRILPEFSCWDDWYIKGESRVIANLHFHPGSLVERGISSAL
jgi:FkbM family methyltransferase